MSSPCATWNVRQAILPMVALLALGLSLTCAAAVAFAAASPPADGDVRSVLAESTSRPPAAVMMTMAPVAESGQVAEGWDGTCATHTAAVCALAAVGAPLSLLTLLLTRRSHSLLGLLARPASRTMRKGRRLQQWRGWFLVSPAALCTWRV